MFETAGFLVGIAGVGSAFWLLYRRQTSRAVGTFTAVPVQRRRV